MAYMKNYLCLVPCFFVLLLVTTRFDTLPSSRDEDLQCSSQFPNLPIRRTNMSSAKNIRYIESICYISPVQF